MERFVNRILLIVEGEDREKIFFSRYKTVKKMEDNLDVVPFRQNIKELYRLCKDYIFGDIKPDNIIDILKDAPSISNNDKMLLEGKFTDIYLIFDLDIQNAETNENVASYLNDIKDLILFFNESTSIGQILINYPSMDSIYHLKDENYKESTIPADIDFSKKYKDYLSKNKMTYDCNKLTQNDFEMIAAINLKKANFIITGQYLPPDNNSYLYDLSQQSLFNAQVEAISKQSIISILNTSLFIDVDLFGRTLFFHERGKRLFNDKELIDSLLNK